MALIRSEDTKPERIVRKYLSAIGIRYRLSLKTLPGKPDIVVHSRKLAIFVHGCFWHAHRRCKVAHVPKSRTAYWRDKLERTVKRDRKSITALRRLGWRILVIWECELANEAAFAARLPKFFSSLDSAAPGVVHLTDS